MQDSGCKVVKCTGACKPSVPLQGITRHLLRHHAPHLPPEAQTTTGLIMPDPRGAAPTAVPLEAIARVWVLHAGLPWCLPSAYTDAYRRLANTTCCMPRETLGNLGTRKQGGRDNPSNCVRCTRRQHLAATSIHNALGTPWQQKLACEQAKPLRCAWQDKTEGNERPTRVVCF